MSSSPSALHATVIGQLNWFEFFSIIAAILSCISILIHIKNYFLDRANIKIQLSGKYCSYFFCPIDYGLTFSNPDDCIAIPSLDITNSSKYPATINEVIIEEKTKEYSHTYHSYLWSQTPSVPIYNDDEIVEAVSYSIADQLSIPKTISGFETIMVSIPFRLTSSDVSSRKEIDISIKIKTSRSCKTLKIKIPELAYLRQQRTLD